MTDMIPPTPSPLQHDDDDRLLAYVLGLEDDAELESAAAVDEGLRHRLDTLRAETAAIADRVARAVPELEDGYADASQPRWDDLRPFFRGDAAESAGAPARNPSALSGWWRVLAPAAAVVLVVAVGAIVLQQQNGGVAGVSDRSAPELAAPAASNDGEQVAKGALDRAAVSRFAVVLIARARDVRDGLQRFDVVRVLRGEAPARISLRVETRPAEEGLLHVLYLAPRDISAGGESPFGLSPAPMPSPSATLSPSPFVTASPATEQYGSPSPGVASAAGELLFTDHGAAALVVALPIGVEPEDVPLP